MKKVLLLVVASLSLNANANMVCSMADQGINYISEKFSTTFKCQNTEKVLADIQSFTKFTQYCDQDTSTPSNYKALISCRFIAKTVALKVVERFPTEWECNVDHSEDVISEVILNICTEVQDRLPQE